MSSLTTEAFALGQVCRAETVTQALAHTNIGFGTRLALDKGGPSTRNYTVTVFYAVGEGRLEMGGLRERTKRRTREEIAGAALRLFLDRGVEAVTVAEIAAAAGVSEKTVYNYFPTKAELVFDADHDLLDDLLAAVRERPVGCSAVSAVRRFLAGAASRLGEGAPAPAQLAFRRLVAESPTLQAHQRQMAARYERELARLLADETGAEPGSAEPFLAAVGLIGGLRAGFETVVHSGGRAAATTRALDLLEAGLADYATKSSSGPRPERSGQPEETAHE